MMKNAETFVTVKKNRDSLTNEKTLVAFLYPKMTRKSKVTRR